MHSNASKIMCLMKTSKKKKTLLYSVPLMLELYAYMYHAECARNVQMCVPLCVGVHILIISI